MWRTELSVSYFKSVERMAKYKSNTTHDRAFPLSTNLIEALERSAREAVQHGITIFDRRGQKSEFYNYAAVLARAQDCAAKFAAAGIGPGDRVLIGLPTCWDLIDALLGCIILRALPTLVAPPGALGGAITHAAKIRGLIDLLGTKRFYCDEATRTLMLESGEPAIAALCLIPSELHALTPATLGAPNPVEPGDIAFMQLTSGSTGRQRAVMIRHSSLLTNVESIRNGLEVQPFSNEQVVVSWLPLNHDMGLVGCLIFSIVYGLEIKLMRPETFLTRPKLWLQLLAASSYTLTAAPNFAYQLCVERVDLADLAGCDLSNWRSALTGAEMIRPETCEAFSKKFAPLGFDPRTFIPSYGMAEATLAITADSRHEGVQTIDAPPEMRSASGTHALVSNGQIIKGTQLHIKPPGSMESLSDGQIGEVCIKGPGVFAGYYNDQEATAAALQDGWLRTGDLGLIQDGNLYLTGRLKDVLIVHGHNIMPHEIEWLAETASGAGGAERCGAFSVPRGTEGEQAVLVLEVGDLPDAELNALAHDIRSRIGRALGLPLADLMFVKRGQIPKTTSGKVQRRELRQRYLDNRLERRL